MLKLVIFDLDGTLVDTSIDIKNALNYAILPFGLPPLALNETIAMVGEGLSRLVEKILQRAASDGSNKSEGAKDEVLGRFLEYYSAHLMDNSTVYPGVRETLERLGGIKKAVISNKREALSKRLLEELGLSRHFDLIAGGDTAAEKKPSAAPVLYVLSALNVSAPECVMVGDSNYDIEAGKKAGVGTVAVTYGYRGREALMGADRMIDGMAELVGLLEGFPDAFPEGGRTTGPVEVG